MNHIIIFKKKSHMKKNLLSLTLCLAVFCFLGTVNAQPSYQIPNGNFENWTTAATAEPNQTWNTFSSANCTLSAMYQLLGGCTSGKANHHNRAVGRDGTGYSMMLYSTWVGFGSIGENANGNLTTGQIRVGDPAPAHADNYNSTVIGNAKHSLQIAGTPDSLYFWAKFRPFIDHATNTSDSARVSFILHGNNNFIDPNHVNNPALYKASAIRNFPNTFGEWKLIKIPFVYNGTNTDPENYALITFATSYLPGGGTANKNQTAKDSLWIDDVMLIYSAWLSDLKVNGTTINGFHKNNLTYGGPTLNCPVGECDFPYQLSNFTYTPEAADIVSVDIDNVPGPLGDADGGYTSILVTAEDGVTQKEYRIYYFSNRSDDNNILAMSYTLDGTAQIPITPFNPAQTDYNITITNPEQVIAPHIVGTSIVLSDMEKAVIQRIEQPTGVNSKGLVAVQAEDLKVKVYNVFFSKELSSNSKLDGIQVEGEDIVDFHPDKLEYNYAITSCVTTSLPEVTYQKSSNWANVTYTPATPTNKTATIKVTAEDNTETVYTINFTLANSNTQMNSYRINATNRASNVFTAANNYTDTYSASYTAPFTLSNHSTTTQHLVCAGATALFPVNTVWYPDTNRIWVTAQDLVTKREYKVVIKNTNCYLKQTTGNNVGLKYMYNGVVRNITVPSATNNNDVTITVAIPVTGPNEPCILMEADPQAPVVDTIIYTQPVNRTGNSGRVRVVANDGVAGKNYIINFTYNPSTDATLRSLTYNGFAVPGFNPGAVLPAVEEYGVILPSSVTEVPIIEFAPNFQWLAEENIVYTPAATLLDTAVIVVTAEDGKAKKTYKIAFKVVPQAIDAYLIDIRYDNNSIPNFNPLVYNYMVDVPYSNPVPPATTPIASSPTAIVLGTEQLTTPPYTKRYFVFSENLDTTRIYTLNFNRVKNTNAALAGIQINGVSLPDFNAGKYDYDYELLYTELNAPVVTATPAFQYAQVVIEQINTVSGTVTIHVTAEDDAYTATYTIDITRELSPVNTIETFTYSYNNNTYTYEMGAETEVTIMLPVETLGTPTLLDVVLTDFRAEYNIDEQPDATNDYTGTIIVTAEDLTEQPYLIAFKRTLSPSTLITGITYNGISIPDFNPDILTYYVMLPFNHSQIPQLAATAAWVNTNIQIANPSSSFGNGTVTVTSENGQNIKIYTIVFQRKGDCHLASLSYSLSGTSYPIPNFSPTTYVYNVLLPKATTATPIVQYTAEDSRCIITAEQPNSPNGTFWVKLVTLNSDDSLTYTVNFTVELSKEALLSNLQVDGITIDNFNVNTFHYSIHYPYGKEELPIVTATATQPDAKVVITQISQYPGTATVTVYAGDTTIVNTYTIAFSVEPGNNTYLEDLKIDGITIWGFNKNIYFYTYSLDFGTTKVPNVTAIPEDPRTTVNILPLNPQVGDTIKIYATAINGDVALYQVLFIPEKNYNAYAEMIYIDWQPLQGFVRYLPNYSYTLPKNYVGEPFVAVKLEDPNASYEIKKSSTIPYQVQIIVTAENGVNTFTYTINFEKLSILSFDNKTEIQVYPNPSSNIIHFEISEQIQTGNLEIYSLEGKKIGSYNLQGGINTIHVEHLQNGIYFYKIFRDGTMLGTGKFVKN